MDRARMIVATLGILTVAAAAPAAEIGYGGRAGYTGDDGFNQIHLGAHAWVADLINANVVVLPSLEIGFGDDATVIAIQGDAVYEFTELAQGAWSFYAGGGIAINRFDVGDADATEFGLNLVGGATWDLPSGGRELLGEIRLGLEDAPDFKLTFGITFF